MDGHPILSPQLKYWMPIHYDTIEYGQKKKISSFIRSFLVRIVLFLHFMISAGFICQKLLFHHFIGFI